MAKYRKKPVVVEAFKLIGNQFQSEAPKWIIKAAQEEKVFFGALDNEYVMFISALEGAKVASFGDYIIKGAQGEIYPCKPDIFEQVCELLEE